VLESGKVVVKVNPPLVNVGVADCCEEPASELEGRIVVVKKVPPLVNVEVIGGCERLVETEELVRGCSGCIVSVTPSVVIVVSAVPVGKGSVSEPMMISEESNTTVSEPMTTV